MKSKKFLITGCCGFIGSHWTEKLLNKGHYVIGIDIKKNNIKNKSKKFKYYRKSITDKIFLNKIIKKVDFVCHLAAIANPAEYVSDPLKVIKLDALSAI